MSNEKIDESELVPIKFDYEKSNSAIIDDKFMMKSKKKEILIAVNDFDSTFKNEQLSFKKGDLFELLGNANDVKVLVREYKGKKKFFANNDILLKCNKTIFEKLGEKNTSELEMNYEKQILHLQKKLDQAKQELEESKQRIRELNSKIPQEVQVVKIEENDPNIEKLMKEGYPKEMLLILKKNIHSSYLRRTLKSLIKKYSVHESAKPQRLRMKIINEIISSEKVYLEQLQKVLKKFYRPMLIESEKHTKNFITRQEINDIFSTMEIICDLSEGFLKDLRGRLSEISLRFSTFGDIFFRLIPVLRIYSFYLRNYENGQKILKKALERSQNFTIYLKSIESGHEPLNFYLIMPVQRLPRYEMLLSQLLQYTPETHVDYSNLKIALEKLKGVTIDINLMKRQDYNNEMIHQLEVRFVNLPFELSSPGRDYIYEGKLHEGFVKPNENPKRSYFILFNNCLIHAHNKTGSRIKFIDIFNFSHGFFINDIADLEENKNCFTLIFDDVKTNTRMVKFFTASVPKDKEEWITMSNAYFDINHAYKLDPGESRKTSTPSLVRSDSKISKKSFFFKKEKTEKELELEKKEKQEKHDRKEKEKKEKQEKKEREKQENNHRKSSISPRKKENK